PAHTLSLHDALPIYLDQAAQRRRPELAGRNRRRGWGLPAPRPACRVRSRRATDARGALRHSAMAIEVAKVILKHVQDASGLEERILAGQFSADDVVAVIGKTEGNGGVNDFT